VRGLDHVQVAAPRGCEADARRFYGDLLGLAEIAKPPALQARGGAWFALGVHQLHVGVEEPFTPARKAHPALLVAHDQLDALASRLAAAGAKVTWDDRLPGARRFYTEDPWGNRLELVAPVLAEQLEYYRAVAPEYEQHAIPGAWGGELLDALEAFKPSGNVLELACGPGTWTERLVRHASNITALDASAEMLAIAASRIRDKRVRFIQADIFSWTPDQCYDVVFFGFWLSHVPLDRFEHFWTLVADCLAPEGRVFFVDDGYRTPDELVFGPESSIVRRRLNDGSTYRVFKIPHEPDALQEQVNRLGWSISITKASEPFFYGVGTRR
jgi:SAM-dependent methyltransferase